MRIKLTRKTRFNNNSTFELAALNVEAVHTLNGDNLKFTYVINQNKLEVLSDVSEVYVWYEPSTTAGLKHGDCYAYNSSNDSKNPKWVVHKVHTIKEIPGAGTFYNESHHHIWCQKLG